MKIAIPVNGQKKGDLVAPHFGRAENLMVYDDQKKTYKFYENPEAAGKEKYPPDFLHEKGVTAVICFGLGEKAIKKFNNYGVKLYHAKQGSLHHNLEELKKGNLDKLYS